MNLADKYLLEEGRVFLTGIQALVRLPLDQMRRDRRNSLNTGTFISGYEGSPLGGYDMALARARKMLEPLQVHFVPGVNEDLAATSVMGSQILHVLGKSKVDGVLGIWYGKGPGVDRCGDVFRHANLAGTGTNCAALVLAGDDHTAKSSTIPHQSDFSFYNIGIPFFYPGNSQEIIDYGLMAVAFSRFSGAWTGMKLVTEVCDGGGTVEVHPDLPHVRIPTGFEKHVDPRLVPPITLALEHEVNFRRLEAARNFARLNSVNRYYGASDRGWLGLVSAGKSYFDLAQALRDLGLDQRDLEALGIRIAKFGMPFPMDDRFAREFAHGLDTILVIEEKRSFLEIQLRDALYSSDTHPRILGKLDESGAPLLPASGELDPDRIAKVVASVIARRTPLVTRPGVASRLDRIERATSGSRELTPTRPPNFCSGCPHNRSTLLLEGQVAGGGIGCHTMAMRIGGDRGFSFLTHMGGEGAPWIGMSPFVNQNHVFQNIGDGTYFHSGSLAIEAAIAAGVNITYKILYNGHVAMTGGQAAVGALPIPQLTRKLEAEGVKRIVVLAEDVSTYSNTPLATNAEARDRDELARTLRELEQIPGVTVLIYDQQCAAEKRRMRSRGLLQEPVKRLVINEEVCEGCGDCVKQSNCMSLVPVATEYGQKTRIHQSSCNKDYTCALGDCPSFVTVNLKPGTGLRKKKLPTLPETQVPLPAQMVSASNGYRILGPGIGGTGVVTVNALLATAASIDGLWVITLDQTGSAQKGGAVVSHLLLSDKPLDAPARTNIGNANLILGFDLIGVANLDNLNCASPDHTVAVINTGLIPTSDSVRRRDTLAGPERLLEIVNAATRPGHNIFIDANRLAEGLFGSHMAVNIFLMGVAWQGGLIPISLPAIESAIQLNAVEVEKNLEVFSWGRKYYQDSGWVEKRLERLLAPKPSEQTSGDLVAARAADLRAYQNEAYAQAYLDFVHHVEEKFPALRDTVGRYLYKLMAYKDEYEVARLLTKPDFEQQVRNMWESVDSISYNLHPPLLRGFGLKKKLKLGSWFQYPLRLLAAVRCVRGTPFDLFGYAEHRRQERALIGWYHNIIEQVLARFHDNETLALEIAALPEQIRGYEKIKTESIDKVKAMAQEKLQLVTNVT